MLRKNVRHTQIPLTARVNELPCFLAGEIAKLLGRDLLSGIFCYLDEQTFAFLYADQPSRPNLLVNVLVGLEFLKAAND